MSPLALIDTSALIGGLPDEVVDELEHYGSSMVVRAELAYGLRSFLARGETERATRRETLLAALDSIAGFWHDFDLEASEGYAHVTASSSEAMRVKDALIAGHALSLSAPIITRDRGFSRFANVTVTVLT